MKIFLIFFYGFVANLLVRIVNTYSSKFQVENFFDILKIVGIMSIPILIYNVFFILYFAFGSKTFSFTILEVTSLFFALLLSMLFQIYLFKNPITTNEIIGLLFILLGIFIMNKDKILLLLK